LGEHGALYAMPMYVNNTNALPSELADDNSSMLLGLGARLRIRPSVYLVGEYTPRIAGYGPGDDLVAFALEKRSGGHVFQITFSNGIASTLGQIGRTDTNTDDWYIGFNISRKFY
jgi:hypothetical protein